MIEATAGAVPLGKPRAEHVMGELAAMAGLPGVEGPPLVAVVYGVSAPPPGPRVVIPHRTTHVQREVGPDLWTDAGADVPILYEAAAPRGEVLARTAGGHPLVVRVGNAVHLGFDLVQAADYYLNGRGEVGWPRDRDDRPQLAGAPAWRRETAAVAVVNHYAALLGRAVAAAAASADLPVFTVRYWPDGAPFALALSHDVDRLRAPRRLEMLRSAGRRARGVVGARYSFAEVLRGPVVYRALPALLAEEKRVGGVSTFFVGADRRGPMDFAYELAEAAPLLKDLAAAGREVGLHASYYSCADGAALAREREALAAALGRDVAGVRGHYLRLGGEPGWGAIASAGFGYDSSFAFAGTPGWRGGAALPYRPFDLAANEPYGFVLVPLAVMDGTLFQHLRLGGEDAFAAARAVADEARGVAGVCPLLWHYRAFAGGSFAPWAEVYRRLVEYALAAGGVPLGHAAVAERYRFNRGIRLRGPVGEGAWEVRLPGPAPGPVVVELAAPWRVAGGDAAPAGPSSFALRAGATGATVRLVREG